MLGPGWEEGCKGCSFMGDHFDGSVIHLAQRDVTLLAVSRAPLPQIEAFKKRVGWRFPWVSSYESDFNRDYHVSFTKDQLATGKVHYNYQERGFPSEEAPGASVFYKDKAGDIFHTYSTYARELDILVGTYNFLDLAPKGRDEEGLESPSSWLRHHDKYVARICKVAGGKDEARQGFRGLGLEGLIPGAQGGRCPISRFPSSRLRRSYRLLCVSPA